ncbi:Protein yqeL [Corynebacterium imitans]|uniref:Ribosomal silencing factor RsfS n=1 Tax=Corynebacterium imitans TaxID=156978 RepID=A0A076NQV1_9CORY|nr:MULTISPECIES: ribosome silencing factor [Corynebacterium]AIJ34060.1 Iojap [Corynebacterium imitans]MCG7278260.1 ribosome silencing factor [Corynebacterium imitans]MDK8306120.1 ribosome silencing factor [Corynebacterium imitans]MDK8637136.1 ribosome silencing factor [Corynebacterium imitans]MDK8772191.1 ribosome silencing factor [Corynebacterium imitans]
MSAAQISIEQATIAAKAADEKLGTNIAVLDVSQVMGITDIFVVVSANNERQVAAIVDEVEAELTEAGLEPKRREGNREFRWVLLDYGDFVVHVQREQEREFYGLDRLYADCPAITVEGIEPYQRPEDFTEVRGVEDLEDLPLAGEAPEDED